MPDLLLSPVEARVVAAMVEKSVTTPQYYPMTVNAVMLAANQKNARHPVMRLSEGEVGAALIRLESERLAARDDRAGRVPKWRHQLHHQLLLRQPALAVLTTLMLRGPQTASELRANAAGLGGPADGEALAVELDALADRAHALVTTLPRQPGQAATRYAHLLCGEPEIPETSPPAPPPSGAARESQIAQLEQRLAALEARVAALENG